MTKKTKLSKKQLLEILSNYNIGESFDFKLIKNGFMHSNYFLEANQGKFILRIYEARNDRQAILEVKVLEKLSFTNIPTPRILLTKEGKYFSEYKNKRIAIFHFLKGKHLEKKRITPKKIKNLGIVLGQMHSSLKNFKPTEVNSKKDYTTSYAKNILKKIKKEKKKNPIFQDEYILNSLKKIKLPKLPMGINHGDMFDDNVLFVGSNVSGVLDFDDCYYGNLLGDVSRGIIYWCIDDVLDFKKCRNFVQSYISQRNLNLKEVEYLYEQTLLIAWVHALHLLEDDVEWTIKLRPIRAIIDLSKITKGEFNLKIFS
ncbi:MAG: hypothetical protein COV59_02150 [Candidatus Magasanikbacteria bacterium CG11_big_fil_rev_8_21_14_0_20_39_34]|uniref:Aminoglycoside phosphotransferase domain-containing protein n=1 Tax=Candidatus Magasanikbacteria bacterium CG11_big_fil_rev_8_21_14_0_20_39_34 TaxID=1974653 RepID=A0A2H0N4Z4_9BACT|nr:MAG: hypothetical protein COV59_02150 [Candidatus Magasanikbacteria bacterium CG11_big_fil_rev_8_21_14_0_20_39_34]